MTLEKLKKEKRRMRILSWVLLVVALLILVVKLTSGCSSIPRQSQQDIREGIVYGEIKDVYMSGLDIMVDVKLDGEQEIEGWGKVSGTLSMRYPYWGREFTGMSHDELLAAAAKGRVKIDTGIGTGFFTSGKHLYIESIN